MYLIKFDIEIKKINREYRLQFWRDKENDIPIKDKIKESFQKESVFEGDYQLVLANTWDGLDHDRLRYLESSAYLIGYFTVNNTKVFLFELKTKGLTGMNNIAIQVYAFGTLSIEDILNEPFKKIRKILKRLDCKLVNKSLVYIYPYNAREKDIESSDLKIIAKLNSSAEYKKNDFVRLSLILTLSVIFLIIALSLDNLSDFKVVFRALFGSGIFYIVTDFIINIVVPRMTNRHKKSVIIDNLSSVIEKTDPIEDIGKVKTLDIPEI